jgi:hypothetical protein
MVCLLSVPNVQASRDVRVETFEFFRIRSKLSFPRKRESSPFNGFMDSRFRGNDKKVRFSKVSL